MTVPSAAEAAATATTLSLWSDEDVRVSDVLAALESLREPEPMPATRTSVLTLVIVAARAASAASAESALRELGGRHPARVLTLVVDRGAPAGIDAEIELLGSAVEGHPVWFEDVRLAVRGPAADHLDSLIEPFTVPDLPVVVWFLDGLPPASDPMLAAADAVLVDARDFGDAACFGSLAALRPVRVVDLSWHRLRPWRELLGSLFEGADMRPFIGGVRTATVAGRTGPRHLLAGWLRDRLHLTPEAVRLETAEHVSIELEAEHDDQRATFTVERTSDARAVRACAHVAGGPTAEMTVPLPEPTAAWGLTDALAHLERDPVYDAALDASLGFTAR